MYTNRLKVALGTMLSAVSIGSISSLVVACQTRESWDTTITITNSWVNPGFFSGIDEKTGAVIQSDKSKAFTKLLEERFNTLKNKDEEAKKYGDVKFELKIDDDKDNYYSKLQANDPNNDLYIANYSYYLSDIWDHSKNVLKKPDFKLVSQAATLKFSWQSDDNVFYKDGSSTDSLRELAEENNNKWLEFGEYPDWYASEKTEKNGKKLEFDGSKYTNFYKKDELTYIYHGAVLIAGTKQQREKIIKDWEDKKWDEFIKNGIVYKDTLSSGKYKYQVSLFARHFNKSIAEIKKDLENNKSYDQYIVKGQSAANQLGKKQGNGKTPLIGFDDEGYYNWNKSKADSVKYKPTEFKSNLTSMSTLNRMTMTAATSPTTTAANEINGMIKNEDNNSVIRTLTMTNPAGYDVVLARRGLLNKQVDLISKALNSLTLTENTYGIYTGYNKFVPIDMGLFEKLVKLQVQAETTDTLVDKIDAVIKQK